MAPDIVKIHKDEPRAGTFLISKGFNRPHKEVLKLIYKYEDRFIRLNNIGNSKPLIKNRVPVTKAGRPVDEILLNEGQTLFLGTLFRNTEPVLDFKEKLVSEFIEMKTALNGLGKHKKSTNYIEARESSKTIRKETTDTMKLFVDYAFSQGSKSANRYYGNFTKMTNGMLFIAEGKFNNLRNVMTTRQLMVVSSAEGIIEKAILEGMKKDVFYKQIYKDVKAKVSMFAELHGQTEIMDKQLKLCK